MRKSKWVRALAAAFAAILIIPLSYRGCGIIGSAVDSLSSKVVSASNHGENLSAGTIMDISGENTLEIKDDDVLFTETRNTDNILNLGGRNLVWKCVISLLHMQPERLLHGSLDNEYMTMINIFISATDPGAIVANTHNFFLETLMLTGLPGLLLALAFTLILVWRMVRVFFAAGAELSVKLLTLPLATVLLKNMGETTLLRYDDITNYVFFLAAGAFLAFSYELFPEKSRKK